MLAELPSVASTLAKNAAGRGLGFIKNPVVQVESNPSDQSREEKQSKSVGGAVEKSVTADGGPQSVGFAGNPVMMLASFNLPLLQLAQVQPGQVAAPASPQTLTEDEVSKLEAAGLDTSRITVVDSSITANNSNNTTSRSAALSRGERRRALELIAVDQAQYDKFKKLDRTLQNAIIDTDSDVISVRNEIDNARVVLSSNGIPIARQGLSLNEAEFTLALNVGLYIGLQADPKHTGSLNPAQHDAVDKQNAATPTTNNQLIEGSPAARGFIARTAPHISRASVTGTNKVEKYAAVDRTVSGDFEVTAVRVLPALGGKVSIPSGTDFVIHTHYVGTSTWTVGNQKITENTGASPGPSDSAVVKAFRVPNYVIRGGSGSPSIYEVGQIPGPTNAITGWRRIDSNGNAGKFKKE